MPKSGQMDMITKREIEAGILAPVLDALANEFGRDKVLAAAGEAIKELARQQGAALAANSKKKTLSEFACVLEQWKKGDALEIEMLEQSDERLFFNVTRCRYAELYKEMGIAHLGTILSCNRDYALIEGFNPDIVLERTQTIMEGDSCCDLRFYMKPDK